MCLTSRSDPFQFARDKKQLEERLNDTTSALQEEEDKGKGLTKSKLKLEGVVHELEDKIAKEEKVSVYLNLSIRWGFVAFSVQVKYSFETYELEWSNHCQLQNCSQLCNLGWWIYIWIITLSD